MRKALIVIDMQNDYLYDKRKKKFTYDTAACVAAANKVIHEYSDAEDDVFYIRHIIQDLPTNRLLFGYSIAGTEGAELYGGLDIVSDKCYDKLLPDALSNKQLRMLLEKMGYKELHLCGLDECGCVGATALGAAKRGYSVSVIKDAVFTVFPENKVAKMREKLAKAGVQYI